MFKAMYSKNEAALVLKRDILFIDKLVLNKIIKLRKCGKTHLIYGKELEQLLDDIWDDNFPNNIKDPTKRNFLYQQYTDKIVKEDKPKRREMLKRQGLLIEVGIN